MNSSCSLPVVEHGNDSGGLYPYHDRDNCGITVKYDVAPIRAVPLTPGARELLRALGLQQKIVATNVGANFAKIRATNSDFVYSGTLAGMAGTVPQEDPSAGGMDLRSALRQFDHPTHISAIYCPAQGRANPGRGLDSLYRETTIIGDIFGVPEAASQLIKQWQVTVDRIAKLNSSEPRAHVAVVDYRGDQLLLAGSSSFTQAVVTAAGGSNIAVGSPAWIPSSWEEIAERNPDYVILVQGSQDPSIALLSQKVIRLEGLDDGLYEASPLVPKLVVFLAQHLHAPR